MKNIIFNRVTFFALRLISFLLKQPGTFKEISPFLVALFFHTKKKRSSPGFLDQSRRISRAARPFVSANGRNFQEAATAEQKA